MHGHINIKFKRKTTVYQVLSFEADKKASCKARKNVHLPHLLGSQPVRNQSGKKTPKSNNKKIKRYPLCTLSEGNYELLSSFLISTL